MIFHLDWGRGWDFASVRRGWGWCHNSPCLTIAWEGGLHCLDSKAGSRESKLVLRNGQFIWTACRLGYFMDGRLLSNSDTIKPLLCWENGQRRKDESQETVGRIRMLLAKVTQADQGLALATSLTSEFDVFLLTMAVWRVLPVTSASAWGSLSGSCPLPDSCTLGS